MTAYQLLGGRADDPFPTSGIDLPAELLADLYGESLIISSEYVGADRRTSAVRHRRDRGGHRSSLRMLEILLIVAATAVVTVFLTLTASHPAVPGASSHSPASSRPSSPLAARTLAYQRLAVTSRSSVARSAARADLARRRAVRRAAAQAAAASRRSRRRAIRVRDQQARRRAAIARRLHRARRVRTARR